MEHCAERQLVKLCIESRNTYTAEKVFLKVEVSDRWSGLLERLEHLNCLLHDLQCCQLPPAQNFTFVWLTMQHIHLDQCDLRQKRQCCVLPLRIVCVCIWCFQRNWELGLY